MSKQLKTTIYLLIAMFCCQFSSNAQVQSIFAADGFAGSQGTTGGGNATPITVSSASAFRSAVSGSSSKVVIVNGNINLGGDVTIGSNTTLVGANTSSGLYNGTVKIQGTNYIIQNLSFGPSSDDVMEISGATKVYVTRCEFHDSTDELCSIVRGADYVTISWCHFYFNSPDSHSFAHLIGNSDGATGDRGKLHTTLHHNWYDDGVRGRQPRVRFGEVHIYNNYYNSNNTDYCVGVGTEAKIRMENSHFDDVDDPWEDYGGSSNGSIGWSGLLFQNSSQPTFMSNSYQVFSVPYSFSADAVSQVESLVKSCAGNVTCGGINPPPPPPPAGSYVQFSNRGSEQCLQVENGSSANNANIEPATCESANWEQMWELESAQENYQYIKNRSSQKCIRVLNGEVIQYDCNDGWWSEMFELIDAGGGYVILKNRVVNQCIRVLNGELVLADCNTGWWSQQFAQNSTGARKISSEDLNVDLTDEPIHFYPNPVKNVFTIQAESGLWSVGRVYGMSGQLLLTKSLAGENASINISELPSGVYFLELEGEALKKRFKLIKE